MPLSLFALESMLLFNSIATRIPPGRDPIFDQILMSLKTFIFGRPKPCRVFFRIQEGRFPEAGNSERGTFLPGKLYLPLHQIRIIFSSARKAIHKKTPVFKTGRGPPLLGFLFVFPSPAARLFLNRSRNRILLTGVERRVSSTSPCRRLDRT